MESTIDLVYGLDTTYTLYGITFFEHRIVTTVTRDPTIVDSWIANIEYLHRFRLRQLVVGLDIEWRPNLNGYKNPVATLQLCVGHSCLIFQLLHASEIPESLYAFLTNPNYTFVGVGIGEDADKLEADYGLDLGRTVDLRELAAARLGQERLMKFGLKKLCKEVLGRELEKRFAVTMSRWDALVLRECQVKYACLDAFTCFEMGRVLHAAAYSEWLTESMAHPMAAAHSEGLVESMTNPMVTAHSEGLIGSMTHPMDPPSEWLTGSMTHGMDAHSSLFLKRPASCLGPPVCSEAAHSSLFFEPPASSLEPQGCLLIAPSSLFLQPSAPSIMLQV